MPDVSGESGQASHGPAAGTRADIDGLRAVAVLLVVAFHSFPTVVKGGFVGVDVFFVISGFLISSLIAQDLTLNRFRFSAFYGRRIRRIFPALLIVLLASYALGWFALLSDEYQALGKHIAGGAGFVSNLVLWQESGYFDSAAETKPLLHLWSLGVEEQFYILWPLQLWLAAKCRVNALAVILPLGLFSFSQNLDQTVLDNHAAFYSPQTRFWELMLGAAVAWAAPLRPTEPVSPEGPALRWLRHALSLAGAALLVRGALTITRDQAFPGWLALLPTGGAALLIAAGAGAWVNRAVLSNRLLVWFGLISFPLYLWHWPILAFARIILQRPPPTEFRLAAALISTLLAWLTYRLIETPLRRPGPGLIRTTALVLLGVTTGGLGYYAFTHEGLGERASNRLFLEDLQRLDPPESRADECRALLGVPARLCRLYGNAGHIEMAVIGDSTGYMLTPGLAETYANADTGVVSFGAFLCPPIRGLMPTAGWGGPMGQNATCPETMKAAYDLILRTPSIKTVVLSILSPYARDWGLPVLGAEGPAPERFKEIAGLLNHDIDDLRAHGKRVILTYDAPQFPHQLMDYVQRPLSFGAPNSSMMPEAALIDRQPYLRLFEESFAGKEGICIFRQSALSGHDGMFDMTDGAGHFLFHDDRHLSVLGSTRMAALLTKSGCLGP